MGEDPLKIYALYKTFDGEEWIEKSLESIYKHVDGIVMVHSELAWDGKTKVNRVSPVVREWAEKNDTEKKIHEFHTGVNNQEAQYKIGFDYIRVTFLYDWIMLIDSDEIWDDENWKKAKRHLMYNPHRAMHCKMHTYIKKPYFRIHPPERARPTVFINRTVREMSGVRWHKIKPKFYMDDVFFHHYTLVRKNEEDIRRKIITSNQQDGANAVDVDWWMREVWDRMPDVNDFHISKGYENSWHSLVRIAPEVPGFLK